MDYSSNYRRVSKLARLPRREMYAMRRLSASCRWSAFIHSFYEHVLASRVCIDGGGGAAAAAVAVAEIESFVFIALKVTCTQFYYVYKYK